MSQIDDLYLAEDGLGLAAALRDGRVSAPGLLEAALARAASINSSLGALCYIDEVGRVARNQTALVGVITGRSLVHE